MSTDSRHIIALTLVGIYTALIIFALASLHARANELTIVCFYILATVYVILVCVHELMTCTTRSKGGVLHITDPHTTIRTVNSSVVATMCLSAFAGYANIYDAYSYSFKSLLLLFPSTVIIIGLDKPAANGMYRYMWIGATVCLSIAYIVVVVLYVRHGLDS